MERRVRTCGICGLEYEVKKEEEHIKYHGEYEGKQLPKYVVNAIIYNANKIMRELGPKAVEPAQKEEVDKAVWTLMHMWYHQEKEEVKKEWEIDDLFEAYREELVKRYPFLKKWETIYE